MYEEVISKLKNEIASSTIKKRNTVRIKKDLTSAVDTLVEARESTADFFNKKIVKKSSELKKENKIKDRSQIPKKREVIWL